MGKVIKVTDDVYKALDAIRREKGLRSPNAAIKKLLEGKIEKVTVSDSKPEPAINKEKDKPEMSHEALRKNIVEIKAMVQKLLDLAGSQKPPQSTETIQTPNLDKCPYCGFKLQGNNIKVELLNIHLPIPRIGIELNYLACPSCEKPLTKITWKPIQQPES